MDGAREGCSRRNGVVSMSLRAWSTRWEDEGDVSMTDKQNEFDGPASLASKWRKLLPGLWVSSEQLTALLTNEGVPTAVVSAG